MVPEEAGLKTGGIGHGHHKQPAWDKKCRCMAQSQGGPPEMLKRMPEDDGGPGTVHIFDLGVANVRSGCVRLQADGFTAMADEGADQSSVASPDIEDWARRQDPLQPAGKGTAGAPEHTVSEA